MDSRVVLGSTGPPITPQVDVEQKIGRRGVGVALRLKDKKRYMTTIKVNILIRLDCLCSLSIIPSHIYRGGLDPFLGKVQQDLTRNLEDNSRNQDSDLN